MVGRRRSAGLVFAAVMLLYSGSAGQDVRLVASVDTTQYAIGEWIDLRVRVDASGKVESISPMIGDALGPFEILKTIPPDGQSEASDLWIFRLTVFEPGEKIIPPLEFQYTLKTDPLTPLHAWTTALPLTITGLEIDPAGEIKDIRGPLTPPWMFEDTVPYLILLAVLALVAAGYLLYKKKKRPEIKAEPRVILPPHQVALSALRELEDKRLWQQGEVKAYYSEATEIIRRFFEGRFGIDALELTSGEILEQLEPVAEAKPLWKEINKFFLTADLVKFATYRPTPEENESELRWAYEIVRSMIPKPVLQEPEKTPEVSGVR